MKKSRFSEERIAYPLPSAASWQPGCRHASRWACTTRADGRCCSARSGMSSARH